MDRQSVQDLLNKYLNGTCTAEEKLQLEQWYNQEMDRIEPLPPIEDLMEVEQEILQRLPVGKHKKPYYLIAAVAVISLFLTVGVFFWANDGQATIHDALPGGNKAVLTLADGRKIDLSSEQDGVILAADAITYADGSELMTEISSDQAHHPSPEAYHTISTPRGGQYQVILPDGSKVWLNAASTLSYPANYDDNNREVKLDGEAYFEVKKRSSINQPKTRSPFTVKTAAQDIRVLGTEFNVSAYSDEEKTKTTLVTGEVRVSTSSDREEIVLLPGQEAVFSGNRMEVNQANIQAATSWKNGDFAFADEDIQRIMRQLARWYDVGIAYQGPITSEKFGGKISRSKKLSQVLQLLEATEGIKFQIEDRKIIVKQP